jgi:ribonuclease HI
VKTARIQRLKVYFDGGCRPNPGPMVAAVVARGGAWFFDDLGNGTSTDAEWLALCKALEVAQSLDAAEFDLIGDSLEVVRVASGAARPGSLSVANHFALYEACAAQGRPRRVKWAPRWQNLAGIALAGRNA